MKSELENFISNNLDAFDTRVPDPAVLERIQQQMKLSQTKKEKAIVIPLKMVRWAVAACFVLVIGGGIFWASQKETTVIQTAAVVNEQQPLTVPEKTMVPETPVVKNEIAVQQVAVTTNNNKSEIEEENNLRKTLLFAKLNNMESPSQRLTAASEVYQMKNTDKEIVDALAKTMNNDPSTNVRLAALDALAKFYRETYVKKKLLSSLDKQTDPMVQIGLIELLTKMKERSILKELDKLVKDGNTMPAVKDHAYSSIFTLRS